MSAATNDHPEFSLIENLGEKLEVLCSDFSGHQLSYSVNSTSGSDHDVKISIAESENANQGNTLVIEELECVNTNQSGEELGMVSITDNTNNGGGRKNRNRTKGRCRNIVN